MITKADILEIARKEFATTVRVMKAFPTDQAAFRPHERSSDAMLLMSTFVFEMYLLGSYLFGDVMDPRRFKEYKPESIEAVIADFEKESADVMRRLEELADDAMERTVAFGGTEFVAGNFAFMMIHDQIHHRGQLSVYVRMAGGKVPSIYGPSADDTGTNL